MKEYLVIEEIIEPIKNALEEIDIIDSDIDNLSSYGKPYLQKGTFTYLVSIFENSIIESLERFLIAKPASIPKDDFKKTYYPDTIFSNILSRDCLEQMISDYTRSITFNDFDKTFKTFCNCLEINGIDYNKKQLTEITEIKERRNILVHNNLKIDRTYISKTKCNPNELGNYLKIDSIYLNDSTVLLRVMLSQIKNLIEEKYCDYTYDNLFKNFWEDLFDSPLMVFEDHWLLKNNKIIGYNSAHLKKVKNSLASSEKTILNYILQNFSNTIWDSCNLKSSDLNMQISNNKSILEVVDFFNRYPLILQR
jgi:hypothetical protein